MDYADLGPAMSEAYTRDLAEKAKSATDQLEERLARIEAAIQKIAFHLLLRVD